MAYKSPCGCLCNNCVPGDKCHYGSYHCHHWVWSYGDLESYNKCLVLEGGGGPRAYELSEHPPE